MNLRSRLFSLGFVLCTAASATAIAADRGSHQGRAPSGGTGAPGTETLDEGTQAGAPGNIVTATEGTVLQAYDVDSDGKITASEASVNGDLSGRFVELDANGDKVLDAKEFRKYTPAKSAVTGTAPTTIEDAKPSKKTH